MSVSEPPPCRCGHPHDSHEHYRAGSDCGLCHCRQYRRATHLTSRAQLVARAEHAEAEVATVRAELVEVKRQLLRTRNRVIAAERALANVAALAPYCEATLDMSGPRIPGPRRAA